MKTRKALLPIIASALLVTMGLVACGGGAGGNNSGNPANSSEVEEEKIIITSPDGKKELQVGETLQLTASVEGAEFSTKSTDIVSVTKEGLVTALKDGSARITAKKEGYENGSFTVTVLKAPEKQWQYEVRLELAEHYDPDDFWGMDASQWGMGILGPGDSPVEDNSGATDDGTSLGWLQQGCKETMTFKSDKAVKVELGVTMAYNAQMTLANVMTVKFNGVAVDLSGVVLDGPEDGNNQNYYEFHAVSLGMLDLVAGNNVLEIEMIAQGPNMDKVVIWTQETLQIEAVPAVVKERIEVAAATLTVEEEKTAQIELTKPASAEGVSFVSDHPEIASVSTSGLVTGVAAGKATITVSKEGWKDATVSVTVTEKPQAGTTILEAESAVLSGAAQIENNNAAAHGGAHVGYLSEGSSVTFTYTAEAAGKLKVIFVAASCANLNWQEQTVDDQVLSECMTLTFNDAPVSLDGRTLIGGTFGEWHDVDLGLLDFVKGENTFVFNFTAQGPNLDYIKIVDPNYVPEVTYTVSFDANGGTGEMAAVTNVSGEYTLPECGFTAPAESEFKAWKVGNQEKQPGDKIYVSADTTIQAVWLSSKMTITFDANGGTGTMEAAKVAPGEYTLPECGFTAPAGRAFGGWDVTTTTTNQWGQPQSVTTTYQVGDKIQVSADMTIKAHWSYAESTTDISGAYLAEAENGELEGGAKVEDNANASGGKAVGYMAAGASIQIRFISSGAGKATLVLLGSTASANWNANPVVYNDQDISANTSIKVNGVDVDLTGKGFNASSGGKTAKIDLGEVDLVEGENVILISAIQQSCNFDAIAVKTSLTISDPLPPVVVGAELENGTFERPEGKDETNCLTVVDEASASNGKAVTNFVAGSKITIKFNAAKAGKLKVKLVASSIKSQWGFLQAQTLNDSMKASFNGSDIDLTGKKVGSDWVQKTYDWSEVVLGEVDVVVGENTIVLEAIGQGGPNLDCLNLQSAEDLTITF